MAHGRNARQAGRSTDEMIGEAMRRTNVAFEQQGRGRGWESWDVEANAQGRVYTSPHLAMVGEGSQNEIIIPTERIRKGLPINAGVARELGVYWCSGLSKWGVIGRVDQCSTDCLHRWLGSWIFQ